MAYIVTQETKRILPDCEETYPYIVKVTQTEVEVTDCPYECDGLGTGCQNVKKFPLSELSAVIADFSWGECQKYGWFDCGSITDLRNELLSLHDAVNSVYTEYFLHEETGALIINTRD